MVTEQMWNGFARESLAEFLSNCSSVCQRLPDRDEDAHIGWQHQHGPRRLRIGNASTILLELSIMLRGGVFRGMAGPPGGPARHHLIIWATASWPSQPMLRPMSKTSISTTLIAVVTGRLLARLCLMICATRRSASRRRRLAGTARQTSGLATPQPLTIQASAVRKTRHGPFGMLLCGRRARQWGEGGPHAIMRAAPRHRITRGTSVRLPCELYGSASHLHLV